MIYVLYVYTYICLYMILHIHPEMYYQFIDH